MIICRIFVNVNERNLIGVSSRLFRISDTRFTHKTICSKLFKQLRLSIDSIYRNIVNIMYGKYLKCIFLLTICIGCKANDVNEYASNIKAPQLSAMVKKAYERSAEASVEQHDKDEPHYYHQHYYVDQPLSVASSSTGVMQKNREQTTYKPRIGEIHVKDSILYNSKTPASSQQQMMAVTRRNYWPLVDNTVTSLASKAAAGANAVKNLLKVGFFHTFDNVNAAVEHKKHKIASYLIQAAQEHKIALQQAQEDEKFQQKMKSTVMAGVPQQLQQQSQFSLQLPLLPLAKPLQQLLPLKQKLAQNVVQHLSMHLKKPQKKSPIEPQLIVYSKTKTLPTTTISDGYIHTFDNKYMPPNLGLPREKNPYADMGVTSYKHFEDTILKELEEKEERKVEATIHTLLDDQYIIQDSLDGTKSGISQEWQPFNVHDNGLFISSSKPITINSFTQSTFDRPFNDIRPVCEPQNEIAIQPTLFVFPANVENHLNELQEASNDNTIKLKLNDFNGKMVNATASNSSIIMEKPNYPAYFIKQQQELRKLQQKLVGAYRNKSQYGSKTTTSVPSRIRQSPYGRRTSTTTTTTTTTTPTPTPITPTTTDAPVYFFSINGTDDGFRPMLPDQIKAMNMPIHIKANKTISLSNAQRPKSSWIQAQASHVKISVVAAPKRGTKSTTTIVSGSKNDIKTTQTRKAPTKLKLTISSENHNSTITTLNKQQYRGSIKFSDSLHQSQNS